jgi:adenine deaminase
MAVAVNKLINSKGGIAAVCNGKCVGSISLPIAGLMTDELCADELTSELKKLHKKVHEQLGCTVHAPFMHLAFLSLTTSPKWKITDKGLIDTSNYCVIPAVKH